MYIIVNMLETGRNDVESHCIISHKYGLNFIPGWYFIISIVCIVMYQALDMK